jgi:hypothetical protein
MKITQRLFDPLINEYEVRMSTSTPKILLKHSVKLKE